MREAELYYNLPKYEYIVEYFDCFFVFDNSNYFCLVLEHCVSIFQ